MERDRVNSYGENDKASRKAIPQFKARSNREARREENQLLDEARARRLTDDEASTDFATALAENDFDRAHPRKRKIPDQPLGHALAQKGGVASLKNDRAPLKGKRDSVQADAVRSRRGLIARRDFLLAHAKRLAQGKSDE